MNSGNLTAETRRASRESWEAIPEFAIVRSTLQYKVKSCMLTRMKVKMMLAALMERILEMIVGGKKVRESRAQAELRVLQRPVRAVDFAGADFYD